MPLLDAFLVDHFVSPASTMRFSVTTVHPFVFLSIWFIYPFPPLAQSPASHITILGSVYCDVCYDNTFSKHSYFLPGVDVHVQCKFKASSTRTREEIAFSVNRTTDRHGMYKLDIPSVEGVDCTKDPIIQSACQASLIGNSVSTACNVPNTRTTAREITVKSKQKNMCTYTLGAMSYKPPRRNLTLCGKSGIERCWNSSKFFLPYVPPHPFPPWPPLPKLPPLPSLPPLPPLPPFLPFPLPVSPNPPFLPFPFPPFPPAFTPPLSMHAPPPPPAFNIGDPRTWIPYNPLLSPPPPRQPSPVFNFRDPRTWIPHCPPSPPTNPTSTQYP